MKSEIEQAVDKLQEQEPGFDQFREWMREVDAYLEQRLGMSSDDLPDWLYRDDYDDGLSPEEAAENAIAYACEEHGIEPEELER